MPKVALLAALIVINTANLFAQSGRTFKVESLPKPEKLLPVSTYRAGLESLIKKENDAGISSKPKTDVAYNIVAQSKLPNQLVTIYGYHSFFEGLYNAYTNHRPLTFSPDMIWLLIGQGFAQHVNNNSEELRNMFVNFKGKTTLVVSNDELSLDNPNSPWEEVFPQFSKQIAGYTGKPLTDALTADFTTTTPITKVASQITLMNAVQYYFDYEVLIRGCGVSQVTLEGTTKDWQHLLEKTEALRKYQLDWWVNAMEPVLKQFIAASKGKIDRKFWKDMFTYKKEGSCIPTSIIDGWIVKFYPYDYQGKRKDLKVINRSALGNNLPNEVVKVDLAFEVDNGGGDVTTIPLELWAGFVGLEQNDDNFGLKPEIGWMIRKKDPYRKVLIDRFTNDLTTNGEVHIKVISVPPELYQIGPIKKLFINFFEDIKIPDELADVKINELTLNGTITTTETERIIKLFPHTKLIINGQKFNTN
jgi:hypothetical protein